MKKLFNLLLVAFLAVSFVACNDDENETVDPAGQLTTTEENGMTVVSGSASANFTMRAGTKYLLRGFVYIQEGATLTIEPGTVIMGESTSRGTLIVERGGKIMADGTVDKPIVFTSNQPVNRRAAGDWGGIIILGKAPVNLGSSAVIEGGVQREYGGTDPNDNSGVLRYVRIEFPGIAFQPNNEINGLTLGGVGAGTTIDYVQVSHCGDDAFEWFGGTVNAKHLIAYKTVDDMFDTDNGFSGKLQFLVGISDPAVADVSASNGFESDNDSNGTSATPITAPTYSNVSLFGPLAPGATATVNSNYGRGLHLRRNNQTKLHNSLVAGWPVGLLLDGAPTETNATAGTFKIQNTVIAGVPAGKALTVTSSSTFDVATWFNAAEKGNSVVSDAATLGLTGSFKQDGAPSFTTGAQLQSGANFTGLDSFFEQVSYIGAFGTTDWTAGWTNWTPNTTAY
ncbi:T9SS C-terminal target domain-containing protein [Pontibacter qinzhouensis]|uniref:T9SS C-terminal target domain-containing protein n=1 Tax=Pontibacter qinzhouensis TaxID=2603253 RepID=A0A5C8K6G6_9BACT|nr:T9SS C-terminal target domain-containing protein [Pontibacter qinzhouensis]TXK44636.1 T9SS C-terminal target domain-containing protein [Pontibacter qinzhouensis]